MTPISGVGSSSDVSGASSVYQQLRQTAMDAAAKALNLSTSDLQQDLESGQTLQQIASSQNADISTVMKSVLDAVQSEVSQDVQSGQINANQVQNVVNGFMSRFGKAHGHGHHHHHSSEQTDQSGQSSQSGQSIDINIEILNYSAQGDNVTQNPPASTGQQFSGEA